MLMKYRLHASEFIKQYFQPALLESDSSLPKLLHLICMSHEEDIEVPES